MSTEHIATSVQEARKHQQNVIDFLKIVTSIHDDADPSKIVTSLLRLLCCYGKSLPYVGKFFAFVEGVLPDEDSKNVGRLLKNLSEQIKAVRQDISESENRIIYEAEKLEGCESVTHIEVGMELLSIMSMSTGAKRQRFEDRLKDFCQDGKMVTAVKKLYKLLTGEISAGFLLQKGILESTYCVTRGHIVKLDSMCLQFLKLVSGGLSVITAYEFLRHGEEGAAERMNSFEGDTERLKTCIEAFQQKCKDCFRDNMKEDLKEVLDSNRSNKDAAAQLCELLRDKYVWLETYTIVCKENMFIDCDFRGNHVKSSEHNGRFSVIFYRDKVEETFPRLITRRADRFNEVRRLIRETDNECWFSDAERINSVLSASIISSGANLWGWATVKASRMISIPLINIFATIGSSKALNSFEISGTWTKAVSDVGGHKHLFLLK